MLVTVVAARRWLGVGAQSVPGTLLTHRHTQPGLSVHCKMS